MKMRTSLSRFLGIVTIQAERRAEISCSLSFFRFFLCLKQFLVNLQIEVFVAVEKKWD